ncbi:MAG TPA: GvpL/GvpF family gas vesicle protein [Streptosporangiaceae bacterium]|nr:GvpL/GvpF family gas vesicle protein [Streptosporangiaceae bacterium]
MTGSYVYAIVPAGAPVPAGLAGIGGRACRVTGARGAVAALVSPMPDRPLGTAADLRAHAGVIDAVARSSAVLPLRFGGVLADEDAVADELLDRNEEEFADRLAWLRDCDQFTVKARYQGDVALREIVSEEPEIMRLREQVRGGDPVACRDQNLQLGELVAAALRRKRQADTEIVAAALAPHAVAIAEHQGTAPDVAADLAFLVERPGQRPFERAAEKIGQQWRDRIRLRLVGPQAPYDFTQ